MANGIISGRGNPHLGVQAMAGSGESPEKLHDSRIPVGDIVGDLLQDSDRAGAPPVVDRVRDVEATPSWVQARHQLGAEQVADERHDPLATGFDGLVFTGSINAATGRGELDSAA